MFHWTPLYSITIHYKNNIQLFFLYTTHVFLLAGEFSGKYSPGITEIFPIHWNKTGYFLLDFNHTYNDDNVTQCYITGDNLQSYSGYLHLFFFAHFSLLLVISLSVNSKLQVCIVLQVSSG